MIVIKAGGNGRVYLQSVCDDVAELVKQGEKVVLVHGGSQDVDQISTQLGKPPIYVAGTTGVVSRYTDRETMEIFAMVVAGRVNKLLVERLQGAGVDALGLCGADGRLLQGTRKETLRVVENGRQKILRGDFSGKIDKVRTDLLHTLLGAGLTPVVAPVAISPEGEMLNVDGDRAAAAIAVAMGAERLVILSNVPGLLRQPADESSLITHIPRAQAESHLNRYAQGKMKKKLIGTLEALQGGVAQVVIADGRISHPLQHALAGQGTVIACEGAGMETSDILALEARHDSGVYNKQSIALVRGEGAWLWDADGRQYIDCIGGHGVANVGHAHPAVTAAIAAQAARLVVCPPNFPNDQRAQLVERLAGLAPAGLERVFFCNSGTEAVEAALKFARLATGRSEIVSTMRGFHGRTFGALSATWNKAYRDPFEPLLPGFRHVPYNNLQAMEAAITDATAAVILEVVQGEGGVIPGDPDTLRGVQALCQERGALLVVDEVQTGFGRTGRTFACAHYGLTPDILCVAKGIAGGLPMGAVLTGPRVGELPKKMHGSTFGGNPLACAAALATLEVLQGEGLPERAATLGAWFMDALRGIDSPLVREVRGLGLMVGMELKRPSGAYLAALAGRGVLALQAGATVMRFLPPLVIEQDALHQVVEAVRAVLTDGQGAA